MNWVKSRIEQERALEKDSEKLWDDLRQAIRETRDVYMREYSVGLISFKLEERQGVGAEQQLHINWSFKDRRDHLILRFCPDERKLHAIQDEFRSFLLIQADDDAKLHFSMDGKRLTVAQTCRLLLEPMLFGKDI